MGTSGSVTSFAEDLHTKTNTFTDCLCCPSIAPRTPCNILETWLLMSLFWIFHDDNHDDDGADDGQNRGDFADILGKILGTSCMAMPALRP